MKFTTQQQKATQSAVRLSEKVASERLWESHPRLNLTDDGFLVWRHDCPERPDLVKCGNPKTVMTWIYPECLHHVNDKRGITNVEATAFLSFCREEFPELLLA
jgi:hypothetical protein